MEQFTVPQFIDVEDKIIGPISVRQFLILLVGGLTGFLFYKIADFTLFIFIAVIDLGFTATLAFFKVNGVPFHFFILNILQTTKRPRLRVWFKEVNVAEIRADLKRPEEKRVTEVIFTKAPLATAPLSQLSLVVDTGGVYKGE
ncbi:MAG: PrgI family protein [bacterium]|nr:PrgI family protein [bacterium]